MGVHFDCRLLAVAVLAGLPPAGAWAQATAGPEFRVNSYTTNAQYSAQASPLAGGGWVAVWSGYQNGAQGVRGQRYDSDGAPLGGELTVAQSGSLVFQGHVAGGNRGDFLVVWSNLDPVSAQQDSFGRRYDGSGSPLGSPYRLNSYTPGDQSIPRAVIDRGGNAWVFWTADGLDGNATGVAARRYDPDGAPRGLEFPVNTYTTDQQAGPFADADDAGNLVVVWSSFQQDGDGFGVFGQRLSASGVREGTEFQVNTYTAGRQDASGVAVDADGDFVVVWSGSPGRDGDNLGVFARRYDRTGSPRSGEFQVNTYTTGLQLDARIDGDAAGNFVIAWRSIGQDGSGDAVMAQRFDSSGARRGTEFRVNTYTTNSQNGAAVASDASGNFVIAWQSNGQDGSQYGVYAQRFGGLDPAALAVDASAAPTSNGNGVFEAGETVGVGPSWRNVNGAAQTVSGVASGFTGPGTSTYTLVDGSANYGTIANGATASCAAAGDCYAVGVTVPSTRPATHWDATVREDILPAVQGQAKLWSLHVGDSFTDVPRTSPFYRFVETMLHRGVTAGCSATLYCPANPTSREQMAVFALVAKEGTGYVPPACGATPVFTDVPASSPFCRWIEELARRGVVGGCAPGLYCPTSVVSREQMAVIVLRTLDPALNPSACTPPNLYSDVPETSPFCRWIEELTRRGVVSGCGGGNYCPTTAVTREQMAVFIAATFALTLYGV